MSSEPRTRKASARELAVFLDTLALPEDDGAPSTTSHSTMLEPEPATTVYQRKVRGPLAVRALRSVPTGEPATVVGVGQLIAVGVPQLRVAARELARDAERAPSPLDWSDSAPPPPRHRVHWSVAVALALCTLVGLYVLLAPAPAAPVAGPAPQLADLGRSEAATGREVQAVQAAPSEVVSPSATPAAESAPAALPSQATPSTLPAPLTPPAADAGAAARGAVDLLLSGRSRAALDAYRALRRDAPAPVLAHVVRLLERELRECEAREREGGPPCE